MALWQFEERFVLPKAVCAKGLRLAVRYENCGNR